MITKNSKSKNNLKKKFGASAGENTSGIYMLEKIMMQQVGPL